MHFAHILEITSQILTYQDIQDNMLIEVMMYITLPLQWGSKRSVGGSQNQAQAPAQTATTPITVNPTVLSNTTGTITVTEMTPEQVTARNYAILSKVSHNPPVHTVFLEFVKSTWRIIGPIAFIVFTAGKSSGFFGVWKPPISSLGFSWVFLRNWAKKCLFLLVFTWVEAKKVRGFSGFYCCFLLFVQPDWTNRTSLHARVGLSTLSIFCSKIDRLCTLVRTCVLPLGNPMFFTLCVFGFSTCMHRHIQVLYPLVVQCFAKCILVLTSVVPFMWSWFSKLPPKRQ